MEFDFKKILKKITSFHGKGTLKPAINPHRDWRTILIVFVILVLGAAAGSTYMFIQMEQDELFTSNGDGEKRIKKFNTSKLVDTINQFEQKEEELNRLRIDRPHIIDPSQ